jgi:hypothetical protein
MPADSRRYNPFELVGVVLIVLLAFASFFISFLLAPLAVLGLFYFILAATDRAKSEVNGNGNGNGHSEPANRADARSGGSGA